MILGTSFRGCLNKRKGIINGRRTDKYCPHTNCLMCYHHVIFIAFGFSSGPSSIIPVTTITAHYTRLIQFPLSESSSFVFNKYKTCPYQEKENAKNVLMQFRASSLCFPSCHQDHITSGSNSSHISNDTCDVSGYNGCWVG